MDRFRAIRTAAAGAGLVVALSGCGGSPAGTPSPSIAHASVSPAPTAQSATPPETGVLPFPTRRAVPLDQARYAASPPFDLALTFETPDDGWESLHLLGEFTDIARFDGVPRSGPPSRWIAFGHPARIHGETDVDAAGLTPAEIADHLRDRDDLETTEPTPFSVAGLDGVQLDLRAPSRDTAIFGGPAGNLSLEPSRDARMGIVVAGEEPLLVLVFAPPEELDDAWNEAQPVLESVALDGAAAP